MFKLKKAQGLSMNVIIVAVLALLVLVILSVVFTGKMRSTTKNIDACENNGGRCFPNEADVLRDPESNYFCEGTYDKITSQYTCKTEEICCIKG